jgi:hypothetical protein
MARSLFAALAGSKNSQTIFDHIRAAILTFFSEHEYKRSLYHGLKNILAMIDQKLRAVADNEDIQHLCNEVFGRAGMELMEVWLKEEIGSSYDEEYYQLLVNEILEKISLAREYEVLTGIFDIQLPRIGIENFLVFYRTISGEYPEFNNTGLKLVYCPAKYRSGKLGASSVYARAGEDSPGGLFCRPIPDPDCFRGFMAMNMDERLCRHFDRIAFALGNMLSRFFTA